MSKSNRMNGSNHEFYPEIQALDFQEPGLMTKTAVQFAMITLLSLSLSGCFGFSFWFERLDTIALWRLDDMFELTADQEDQAEPVLEALQEWLRNEAFPDVIPRLQHIETLWRRGELEQAFLTLEVDTQYLVNRFLQESWPMIVPLLEQFTAKNARAYLAYGESKTDDWFDETESEEAKLEDRIDRLEDWFGHLNDAQLQLVETHTRLFTNERTIRIDNSRQRRERYMELALAGDIPAMQRVYTHPADVQTPQYRQWREQERQQIHQLFRQLVPTLSEKQRRYTGKKLRRWITNLEAVVQP
ncbi:MAG: DUF6279 family lipoprotein [Exilibacterium sp.]